MGPLELVYEEPPHPYAYFDVPTIQAVDEAESTIYVLRRPGHEPVMAHWPQPLEALAPDAIRISSYSEPELRHGVVVAVSVNVTDDVFRFRGDGPSRKEQQDERRALRERTERLKAWRRARPGRFLRTGRKHNKNARISESEIRQIQYRHYIGFESLRSICRELWREKGYASDKSMMNTLCDTLTSYGLKKRTRAEMTTHLNRQRSLRLPGETKDEYRRRKRREEGRCRSCTAVVKAIGKRSGKPCLTPALLDSDFCWNHDPRYAEERDRLAENARANLPTHEWVPWAEIQAELEPWLNGAKYPAKTLSEATGVSHGVCSRLLLGQREQVTTTMAERLLAPIRNRAA